MAADKFSSYFQLFHRFVESISVFYPAKFDYGLAVAALTAVFYDWGEQI